MIKVAFIRGQYLNNFELQSYYPLLKNHNFSITGFTSQRPMHSVQIPIKKFYSPVDLPNFPYKLPLLNRVFMDSMYLLGMEQALGGYHIAHARETYFHFSSQAVAAKHKGYISKVLVTCSETIPFNHETIRGRKKLKNQVLTGADHFHCLTEKAKKALTTEGVSEEKITVIPYGIDLQRFKFKNKPKSSTFLKILFVGRLEEQKGIVELMEVWQNIRKQHSHIKLVVVGSGPMEQLVRKSGIEPISYPYSKMPEIMRDADILVLPSKPTQYWEEYLGMVLLEAMACGLPIVTTTCGAIPEVVGEAAVVVAHSNTQALFLGLEQLVENPSQRQELRVLGQKRVKTKFNAETQAQKLGLLYQTLIKSHAQISS
jgi:glycosyltransferase involved in cell wall biosynthesis